MQVYIEKCIFEDIFESLKNHKSKYDIDDKTFEKFCKMRIKVYMKQIALKNISTDKNKKYTSCNFLKNKKNKCNARIWSNGYGLQCSNSIKKNDLCKTHNNMLEKHGVLRYGTTDLPKPRHDFIDDKPLNWK
jgi:hypothetical protein